MIVIIWIDLKLSMKSLKKIRLLSLKKIRSHTWPCNLIFAIAESQTAQKSIVTATEEAKFVGKSVNAPIVIIARPIKIKKKFKILNQRKSSKLTDLFIFFISKLLKEANCAIFYGSNQRSKNFKKNIYL